MHFGRPWSLLCQVVFLITACGFGIGCASTNREDVVLRERTGLDVSAARFRLQIRSLARPFGGIIEGAADRILDHATTPEERILALRLKINGIPAMQGALFGADPVGAVFESAVLLAQMEIFLSSARGSDLPEEVHSETTEAVNEMKRRLRQTGELLGADEEQMASLWKHAEDWAKQHPITDSFVSRETTQALFADFLTSSGSSLGSFAVRLEESVQDITLRFDLYAEFIAKQARWQAELLLEEALARGLPRRLLDEVGPVAIDLDPLGAEIDRQRALALEAVAAERGLILEWAHGEGTTMLEAAVSELETITAREREELVAALTAERQILLADVDRQRSATMIDLEALLDRAIVKSRKEVVDYALWRIIQLLAVVLPLVFLAALALVWYGKRR